MNKETPIMHRIMYALSLEGCTVFRNETGSGWAGKVIHKEAGSVTIANPRLIEFGLRKGSADIIGWMSDGRFLAVEVKTTKGRRSEDQIKFIDRVNAAGGVGFFATSAEEAVKEVRKRQ